jgi:hypothetical protein
LPGEFRFASFLFFPRFQWAKVRSERKVWFIAGAENDGINLKDHVIDQFDLAVAEEARTP